MIAVGRAPVIVAEDDPFLRVVQVVLDPRTSEERRAAFAAFFAHDLPDFDGWCQQVRGAAGGLYPAEVRLVGTQAELRAALPGADALIVESLQVADAELDVCDRLSVVQKFGALTRNIDSGACAGRQLRVLTLARRSNIACAEHAFALMLALAKKLNQIGGLISVEQLEAAGYAPASFDRRHTANSGWARIGGLRVLYESTLGIVGMGEIGRELARRAAAFGMHVLYYQRTRLPRSEEQFLHVRHTSLDDLLARSDWVSVLLPRGASTQNLFGRAQIERMKPGACLINIAQADIVDRDAVIEALASGHLSGFALDPLYEEPGRPDDDLLRFPNVLLTPHTAAQPRFNALSDLQELITGLAQALAPISR